MDWRNISSNKKVISLLKQRDEIEKQIRELDDMALVNYELENLSISTDKKTHKWGIGKKVKVTRCIYGHEFEIGDIVEISDEDRNQKSNWLCFGNGIFWWLSEDEGEII